MDWPQFWDGDVDFAFCSDVSVDPGESVIWQDSASSLNISVVGGDNRYRLRPGDWMFADVISTSHLVSRARTGTSRRDHDHFVADQVIPRLMAHEGTFVFHAGAVRYGGAAILFMGLSGRGKSTLVSSFSQAGMPLIGDDALVFSMVHGVPHVRPVYPSLRLFPDSIEAIMPDVATTGPVAQYTSKQRIHVQSTKDAWTPLPIHALFAIAEPATSDSIGVRRLTKAEACMSLVESGFALDPTDLDRARNRMKQASELANAVPAFELSYPRDYARLREVREVVLSQLQDVR